MKLRDIPRQRLLLFNLVVLVLTMAGICTVVPTVFDAFFDHSVLHKTVWCYGLAVWMLATIALILAFFLDTRPQLQFAGYRLRYATTKDSKALINLLRRFSEEAASETPKSSFDRWLQHTSPLLRVVEGMTEPRRFLALFKPYYTTLGYYSLFCFRKPAFEALRSGNLDYFDFPLSSLSPCRCGPDEMASPEPACLFVMDAITFGQKNANFSGAFLIVDLIWQVERMMILNPAIECVAALIAPPDTRTQYGELGAGEMLMKKYGFLRCDEFRDQRHDRKQDRMQLFVLERDKLLAQIAGARQQRTGEHRLFHENRFCSDYLLSRRERWIAEEIGDPDLVLQVEA